MKTTNKRIWLGIRKRLGRNFSLFLLLVMMISSVSGFLVTADSVLIKYDEIMRDGNVEDGQFTTAYPLDENVLNEIDKLNVYVEKMAYFEVKMDGNNNLRIYENRKVIDKAVVTKGRIATNDSEITLNRLYAENNNINIGEKLTIPSSYFKDGKSRTLSVVGFVSTPDYNAVFSKNTELMFDAQSFGIGMIDKSLMDKAVQSCLVYQNGYKFNDKVNDNTAKSKNKKILDIVSKKNILMSFMPKDSNNAITFMTDDMGGDKPMMIVFFCIMLSVISLVFWAISSSIIAEEAGIIGTLMANGYRRSELIKLYLSGPVIITIFAGIVGNILGYTVMTKPMESMYYKSFELPNFEPYFNMDAFVMTTVIPVVIMLSINLICISRKLRFSPLEFIRGALTKKGRKKAKNIPFKKFKTRFISRVIIKQKGDYAVMMIGIFISSILLFYGLSINPTFDNYTKNTREGMVSNYQYILKAPVELNSEKSNNGAKQKDNNLDLTSRGVEKLTMSSSQVYIPIRGEKEDISIIGVSENSRYFKNLKVANNPEHIIASKSLCKKAGLQIGDSVDVWDKFTGKKKIYKIVGVYDYPSSLSLFMSKDILNKNIDKEQEYFNCYLSDHKLDIDENYVATIIDKSVAGDAGKQLKQIMGPLIGVFSTVSALFFFIIMFMLTKLILEKNSLNIAYLKVFGYRTKEIKSIYLGGSTFVLLLTIALGIPLEIKSLEYISLIAMSKFSGYFEMTIDKKSIIVAIIVPVLVYILIMVLQMRKISRMSFAEALKNRE